MSLIGDVIVAALEAAVKGNFTPPQAQAPAPLPGPRPNVAAARQAGSGVPAAPPRPEAEPNPVTRGSRDRSQAASQATVLATEVRRAPQTVLDDLFGDRQALVRAVVVSEILGPPRSLRE